MDFQSFFPQELHINFVEDFKRNQENIISGIGNNTSKVFFFRKLINHLNSQKIFQNFLWVCENEQQAQEIFNYFCDFTSIPVFFYNNQDKEKQTFSNLLTLCELQQDQNKSKIILTTLDKLNKKSFTYDQLKNNSLFLQLKNKINTVKLFDQIIQLGYTFSKDKNLQKGEYNKQGNLLNIFPINSDDPLKIEIDFEQIQNIWEIKRTKTKTLSISKKEFNLFPFKLNSTYQDKLFIETLTPKNTLILDEIEEISSSLQNKIKTIQSKKLIFTSFPKTQNNYLHLRYLSLLKFYNIFDFLNDLKDKITRDWEIIILLKYPQEIQSILEAEKINYTSDPKSKCKVKVIPLKEKQNTPSSFQNPEYKIELLTDKEIFNIKKKNRNKNINTLQMEILTSLKEGDFVVHFDHGIGKFTGIKQITVDHHTREYLEIHYAEKDKLFVPVDQADKVSRFIGGEDGNEPKLSRLGSNEWKNITRKVKKETQKIAKELLGLYAKRAQVKGFAFYQDNIKQKEFEKTFPYEETPGQIKAITDTKQDMEKKTPMDRLVCGDVGFGKTEVALRAAFKAVQSHKQVAIVSPVTILTDQHYRSFKKRMQNFNVNIEMLSRFRSAAQQKQILKDLKKGKIDIIIGTHRLLQPDVEFFDLGLVIIDEEQRFGVKQKEKLKSLRSSVDMLTLTATPIPRTLNMSLHKLRDITTITTPPPGRLPIITEVRKYSDKLVKEALEKELVRDGQVYFLHNRVETIEAMAHKLKQLVPQAKIIVAHGQLDASELEKRIIAFKEKEYNILVSSTIIENGIDLPNANTLIVNNTEMFGLSQLYQLRGRIGRGKTQAYAYFLYHAQKLKLDARKRLKAIVEASELGSGFQIAMKDLEIRGAGDILGANQHGSINTVGVNHFIRLLNQTIAEMKSGTENKEGEIGQDVLIEIPLNAFIPNEYIHDPKEKILTYQRIASLKNEQDLIELKTEIVEEFGSLPDEVSNLFKVILLKLFAKKANVVGIKTVAKGNQGKELFLNLNNQVTAEHIINLLQHNSKWTISGNSLKIDFQDLGFNWIEEVQNALKKLSQKIKKT